jgi:hypothetical protein
MLTVYRPLKKEEVSSATGLALEDTAVELLVDRCASFVRERGANIEFVHQSARDYLAQEAQIALKSYESWGHDEVALSCLRYLSQHLKVNLVNLPRPDSERGSWKSLRDMAGKGPLESVDYAATFWAQHLGDAGSTKLSRDTLGHEGEVVAILRAKLLEWFECLSLLDQLPRAVEALKILADTVQVSLLTNNFFTWSLTKRCEAGFSLIGPCPGRHTFPIATLLHYSDLAAADLQLYHSPQSPYQPSESSKY